MMAAGYGCRDSAQKSRTGRQKLYKIMQLVETTKRNGCKYPGIPNFQKIDGEKEVYILTTARQSANLLVYD
jgi:hypothetical protein